MEFGTTEIEDAVRKDGGVEAYEPEPSYYEAFRAGVQNFTSVSLSSSEANYYKEERDTQKKDWIKTNPENEAMYDRITSIDKSIIEKLDALYDTGDYDQIRNWHTSTDSSMINVSGIGVGTDYLKFRELQSSLGLTNTNDIINNAQIKSKDDYYKSAEVLEKSDHWTAEALGTMWGALHDPLTLATLPLGTWKAGGTVLTNAGKAALEEMKIEAMAQVVIAPTVASYKQELEIKTTLAQEATSAVVSIGTAGLVRGTGSAAFDLTAKGMKALKAKDPKLGGDYEHMVKSQATEDTTEHINNLHKAEFDDSGIEEIKNPNAKGEELNKAEPLIEDNPEVVMKAQEATAQPKADEVLQVKEPIETLDPEIVQKYIGAKGEEKATASTKLDEALQKVEGDYEGVAIRGMLDTEGTLGKLEVGDDYTTRGVTSIAKDKKTAETFVDRSWDKEAKGEKIYVNFESFINKPVNLGEGNKLGFDNVLDPKGGKYSFLEDEVVIPSGRKFEIAKKEKIGDETHYTVKEVDGPSQEAQTEAELMAEAEELFGAVDEVKIKDIPDEIVIEKVEPKVEDTRPKEVIDFEKVAQEQTAKHGDLDDLDYDMLDTSNRDLTRVQRAKQTIEEIQADPDESIYTVPDYDEFIENYPDQFRYAQPKITPITEGDKVKIFRSSVGEIEAGDWIGLDKAYAESHARTPEHKTFETWVDKKDIRWQGADANEWIYLPKSLLDSDIQYKFVEPIKAKKVPTRAAEISDAAQPRIGGSEEEAKEAVKNLFKKKLDADTKYRNMTRQDIGEYDRLYKEDIKTMPAEKAISKDPLDFEVSVGVDEAGDTITKSYRTMTDEVDLEAQYIAKAKECFL